MNNRRNTYLGLLLAAVLSLIILGGCRAFEPEAIVVNKAPETFIVGAPIEGGGGYFHFHVFWYGSDSDGRVERFVWAITDTTLQDDETSEDEEDQNFNPALDASTLEIAHWTTKTDSIFNFTIDQGVSSSVDMTLHMVAIDDLGDYDRSPARLHFFSNTLGNPEIRFFEITDAGPVALDPDVPDTVGFGKSFQVGWAGSTPNVRGYSPTALALIDTVLPFDDGLFGYKWQLMGDLGGGCLASITDCWHPRRFNEATGDSFSFFGKATSLLFKNNGTEEGPFGELLNSGEVDLQVNSIDLAGVEVAKHLRPYTFVVNYDPQTILLNGISDPEHPGEDNDQKYPYYTLLNDTSTPPVKYVFEDGDRIPDRTYVTFKALVRDHPEDTKLAAGEDVYDVGVTGFMEGLRSNFLGGVFGFSSGASEVNWLSPTSEPVWGVPDGCEDCWYADTLGFLTAPSTRYTMTMMAVDQHDRRDGNPPTLSFEVGYPPCVQCVELLPKSDSVSQVPADVACVGDDSRNPGATAYDPTFSFVPEATHQCFQETTEIRVVSSPVPSDNNLESKNEFGLAMLIDKNSYFVRIGPNVSNPADRDPSLYYIGVDVFQMSVLLHGLDDPRESYDEAERRMMGYMYQIDTACDTLNQIKDGGGEDNINSVTWGEPKSTAFNANRLSIDPVSGLWRLTVDVPVPSLLFQGKDIFYGFIFNALAGFDPVIADEIIEATLRQFGEGTIRVVAVDQTECGAIPNRPAKYPFFKHVRPPAVLPLPESWRDCDLLVPDLKDRLLLSRGAMSSIDRTDEAQVPVVKKFNITIELNNGGGDVTCETQFGF